MIESGAHPGCPTGHSVRKARLADGSGRRYTDTVGVVPVRSVHPYGSLTAVISKSGVAGNGKNIRIRPLVRSRLYALSLSLKVLMGSLEQVAPSTMRNIGSVPPLA